MRKQLPGLSCAFLNGIWFIMRYLSIQAETRINSIWLAMAMPPYTICWILVPYRDVKMETRSIHTTTFSSYYIHPILPHYSSWRNSKLFILILFHLFFIQTISMYFYYILQGTENKYYKQNKYIFRSRNLLHTFKLI